MLERLQKLISRAGIASRRHAEQLILSGAVTVNGRVITELGTKADAERDHITVGPRVVRSPQSAVQAYFAFYKPARVVSTMNDPEGRPCLGPYVRNTKGRLFPVGRLEFDASGLLLLTSDGELASDLMRASAAIPQVWRFKVKGRIAVDVGRAMEREAHARLRLHRDAANAWYEAELRNAPRDLLRQTLLRHGFFVEKMARTGFAGIELGPLRAGEMRELAPEEVKSLVRAARGRTGPPEERREPQAIPIRRGHASGGKRPAPSAASRPGAKYRDAERSNRSRKPRQAAAGRPRSGRRPRKRAE
ncbi:MAG TPA: S4 domain-containing protein [Candidatus Acidoferrales bacterium]|nr:S4 domain-containing protein [Candidatus Acidoferrales bacterium]